MTALMHDLRGLFDKVLDNLLSTCGGMISRFVQ